MSDDRDFHDWSIKGDIREDFEEEEFEFEEYSEDEAENVRYLNDMVELGLNIPSAMHGLNDYPKNRKEYK